MDGMGRYGMSQQQDMAFPHVLRHVKKKVWTPKPPGWYSLSIQAHSLLYYNYNDVKGHIIYIILNYESHITIMSYNPCNICTHVYIYIY